MLIGFKILTDPPNLCATLNYAFKSFKMSPNEKF